MIYLSSFFKFQKETGLDNKNGLQLNWFNEVYSAARWQPKFANYVELKVFAPAKLGGGKLQWEGGPENFYEAYLNLLKSKGRIKEVKKQCDIFLKHPEKKIVLLCWCTIEQQKKKGHDTVMCHTIALGWFLDSLGLEVQFDKDRLMHGIDYKGILEKKRADDLLV